MHRPDPPRLLLAMRPRARRGTPTGTLGEAPRASPASPALVGSSNGETSGPSASAIARFARWASPPESEAQGAPSFSGGEPPKLSGMALGRGPHLDRVAVPLRAEGQHLVQVVARAARDGGPVLADHARAVAAVLRRSLRGGHRRGHELRQRLQQLRLAGAGLAGRHRAPAPQLGGTSDS